MNKGIPFDKLDNIDREFNEMTNISLDVDTKKKVLDLIQWIEDNENNNKIHGKKKGDVFEELILLILNSTKIFNSRQNENTTSNEIDFLVSLNWNGKRLRDRKYIPKWFPDHFLIECKNHKKPVEVGLVGKFFSLVDVSDMSLGIFISNKGISGRGASHWEDAAAFVNKVNLKYSESQNRIILLDMSLNDIKKLTNDSCNIIELIDDRKICIFNDINSNVFSEVTPHENNGKFNVT